MTQRQNFKIQFSKLILPEETFKVYKDVVGFILNCQLSVLGIRARWLVPLIKSQ